MRPAKGPVHWACASQRLTPAHGLTCERADDLVLWCSESQESLPVVGLPPLVAAQGVTAHALGMTRLLQVLLLFAEDAVLEEEPEVQQREEATQKTRARRLPVHVY